MTREEKQKEQKLAEYPEKGNEYWFGFNEGKGTVLDRPEEYGLCKPAEWSEEDEKMRDRLIDRLQFITLNTRTDTTSPNITFFDEIAWLKSLRPPEYSPTFPIMPTPRTSWGCDGTICTNPQMDCINCPRTLHYSINTSDSSGAEPLTAKQKEK